MNQEDILLCDKGEWFRHRLCAVNDGKLVHAACQIGNCLCNYVSCLQHICNDLDKISRGESSNWTEADANAFYRKVKENLHKSILSAIEFCKANNIP